ncbi:aminotransferase class I/II-fold pyridoxal phosphate-dependent enzyme [Rathayibacter iranicus]|nr:aminotransferase class I/II-fold pyridoxal phosphate-dependent enzyme [Rathayibacter iranicus]
MARGAGMADPFWDEALAAKVHGLDLSRTGSHAMFTISGRELSNMSSYSYLGLDENADIIEAAKTQIAKSGVLNSSLSRVRVRLKTLSEAEDRLSSLFRADVGTVTSCAAGVWAMLPLIASGLLTDDVRPIVVFDRFAHFCLQSIRGLCAVETEVQTIGHNDMERLEEICKSNKVVVYVGDSVYSTGGTTAPMEKLIELQDKYGLFLFLDEAHSTSVLGAKGRGLALDAMGEINRRTILVTSLNKGFGASGGAIVFGPTADKSRRERALRNGGPFMWSQRINTAGLGAIIASCALHESAVLPALQDQLRVAREAFDTNYPLQSANAASPVRFIPIGDEKQTIRLSRALMNRGYYVEPDFYPVVMWGHAGLRVRLRANMSVAEVSRFTSTLEQVVPSVSITPPSENSNTRRS